MHACTPTDPFWSDASIPAYVRPLLLESLAHAYTFAYRFPGLCAYSCAYEPLPDLLCMRSAVYHSRRLVSALCSR